MKFQTLTLAAVVAMMASCSNAETENNETSTEAPATEEAASTTTQSDDPLAYEDGARVFFMNPTAGAVVSSPVHVDMGAENIEVVPAGELAYNTGHHHIIINKGHISKGEVVPADEQHIHYGGGQVETDLELEPGNYTLTLQFANGLHQSYGEALSETIEITVE